MITATVLQGTRVTRPRDELLHTCKTVIETVLTGMPGSGFTTPAVMPPHYVDLGKGVLRQDLVVALNLNRGIRANSINGLERKIASALAEALGIAGLRVRVKIGPPNLDINQSKLAAPRLSIAEANKQFRDRLHPDKIPAGLGRVSLIGVAVGADLDI